MAKLIVTEPWSFGDSNGVGPFSVSLKKTKYEQWLVIFSQEVLYNGNQTRYLLAKQQEKSEIDLANDHYTDVVLSMAYISGLSESNLNDYDLDDHRGDFLEGEVSNN